jgi:hypothetical protein
MLSLVHVSLESLFDLKRDAGENRKKSSAKEEESPNDDKEPQRAPKRKGQKSADEGDEGGANDRKS